jgi:hypothetical protein
MGGRPGLLRFRQPFNGSHDELGAERAVRLPGLPVIIYYYDGQEPRRGDVLAL